MRPRSTRKEQANRILVLIAMLPKAKAVPDIALRGTMLQSLPVLMPAIKCQHQFGPNLRER